MTKHALGVIDLGKRSNITTGVVVKMKTSEAFRGFDLKTRSMV